jgi:hypothetical protein
MKSTEKWLKDRANRGGAVLVVMSIMNSETGEKLYEYKA